MSNEPPSPEDSGYRPYIPPLPRPSAGPDTGAEQRKAQARAEMEAMARRNRSLSVVTRIAGVLVVIGGIYLVLHWISGTILGSHYRAGVKAYEKFAKNEQSCNGKDLWRDRAASLLGEAIQSRPAQFTDAYVYLASMKLLQYRCELIHQGASADPDLLTQARTDCTDALGYVADDAAARYFLGAVDLFQSDTSGCLSDLDQCRKDADQEFAAGSKPQEEWKKQAQRMKDLVSGSPGQSTSQFQLLPIPAMLPAWTMVH